MISIVVFVEKKQLSRVQIEGSTIFITLSFKKTPCLSAGGEKVWVLLYLVNSGDFFGFFLFVCLPVLLLSDSCECIFAFLHGHKNVIFVKTHISMVQIQLNTVFISLSKEDLNYFMMAVYLEGSSNCNRGNYCFCRM